MTPQPEIQRETHNSSLILFFFFFLHGCDLIFVALTFLYCFLTLSPPHIKLIYLVTGKEIVFCPYIPVTFISGYLKSLLCQTEILKEGKRKIGFLFLKKFFLTFHSCNSISAQIYHNCNEREFIRKKSLTKVLIYLHHNLANFKSKPKKYYVSY